MCDGQFVEGVKGGQLNVCDSVSSDAVVRDFFVEATVQGATEALIVQACDDFGVLEVSIAIEHLLTVEGNQRSHPAVAMDDIRRPAQFAHRLQNSAGEEDGALVVVRDQFVLGIKPSHFLLEVVLVVDEVYLHPCRRDGGDLDDQGVISVVDVEVHAAKTDDLMKLVTALVDDAKARHEYADFAAPLMDSLRNMPACLADWAFRKERLNCLTNVKNAGLAHESRFPEIITGLTQI